MTVLPTRVGNLGNTFSHFSANLRSWEGEIRAASPYVIPGYYELPPLEVIEDARVGLNNFSFNLNNSIKT